MCGLSTFWKPRGLSTPVGDYTFTTCAKFLVLNNYSQFPSDVFTLRLNASGRTGRKIRAEYYLSYLYPSLLTPLSFIRCIPLPHSLISRMRCVWLTTLPPSCADCFKIWEPQPPGTLRACPGL